MPTSADQTIRYRTVARRRPPTVRTVRLGSSGLLSAFLGTAPTSWYDARDLTSTAQQTLANRVGAGSATLGSTGSSDANDPSSLPVDPLGPYVYLPGSTSNRVYITQTGILATGAPGIGQCGRFNWDMQSYGVASRICLIGNDTAVNVETSRQMSINWRSSAGSYQSAVVTTGALPADFYTGGVPYQIGFDVTGTNTVSFYYRAGGSGVALGTAATGSWSGWTLLETVTGSGRSFNTAWNDTTLVDLSSANNGSLHLKGNFYGASVSTASPATEFRVIPSTDTVGLTGWTSSSGHTVLITRSTTGYTAQVVTRARLAFDGTDDYLQLPAGDIPTVTATTGAETVLLIYSLPALPGASMLYDSTSGPGAGGLQIYSAGSAGAVQLNAALTGTSTTVNVASSSTAKDDNTVRTAGCVVNAGTLAIYYDTTLSAASSTATVGPMTLVSPRIGTRGYAVNTCYRGSVLAVVRWSRALIKAELDTASSFLQSTYA